MIMKSLRNSAEAFFSVVQIVREDWIVHLWYSQQRP